MVSHILHFAVPKNTLSLLLAAQPQVDRIGFSSEKLYIELKFRAAANLNSTISINTTVTHQVCLSNKADARE
jgi:hypothetical protein